MSAHHQYARRIDGAAPDGRERKCVRCDLHVRRHRIDAIQIPDVRVQQGMAGRRVKVEVWSYRADEETRWTWAWDLPGCKPKAGRPSVVRHSAGGLAFPKPERRSSVKAKKRALHATSTSEIRAAVVARANGQCEACGKICVLAGEMDHWLSGIGRRREKQSVETCWLLCRGCHRLRTDNLPSAAHWNALFAKHCERHGYGFTPHLKKPAGARP